ncbi:hypothetical protein HHI36_013624 [Cryptolaemus montrouzieri]|uniref:Uncharacterized protein n=1 Tax=Cryptolaemus montrouzieri TaxID=559131 RepID=A0ABD2NI95_9CUCU
MEENSAMCEKILRSLENILSTDEEIQEFTVIPTAENKHNKSPVLYEQNCLGLESWCRKYLLQYTHDVLLKNRKALLRNQLSLENMKNLNHILIGALLIQPNVTTFWNMKRELVKSEILDVEQELYFSKLALSQHSKCSEIFSYRKWLINLLLFKETYLRILENELSVCEMAAEKSKNNYHSWNHRIWCLEKFSKQQSDIESIVLSELNFSIKWIPKHISENSGYYYRQILLMNLNNLKSISINIFENSNFDNIIEYFKLLIFNEEHYSTLHYLLGKSNNYSIIESYPKYFNMLSILLNDLIYISAELNYLYRDHECLWNYRKFLMVYLMKMIHEYYGIEFTYNLQVKNPYVGDFMSVNILNLDIDTSNVGAVISKQIASCELYNILIKHEIEFIRNNKNMTNSLQNNLAVMYFKWLKCTNFYNDEFYEQLLENIEWGFRKGFDRSHDEFRIIYSESEKIKRTVISN